MPSTTEEGIDPQEINLHLEHLLKSDLLRRSERLSHLLEYLVTKTLQGGGEHVKESVIAIEAFNRTSSFDSRFDNIVRVHAHRLRKLLDTWYDTEGAHETLRFVIPKGGYMLRVQRADEARLQETPQRTAQEKAAADDVSLEIARFDMEPAPATPFAAPGRAADGPFRSLRIVAAAALAAGLLLGGAMTYGALHWQGMIAQAPVPKGADSLVQPPLGALWKSVFHPGSKCVVSFTNPVFLRSNLPGSRLYVTYHGPLNAPGGTEMSVASRDPLLDRRVAGLGPFYFSDSWTGTGEVAAVHRLTELASGAGFQLRLIRSRALTFNDVNGSNVIFLGSAWANDLQTKFNIGMTPFQCFGTDRIVDNSPKPGEPAAFYSEFNPATKEMTASYALFSVLPGVSSGTKIISSSGIDTNATLAGIDLMTSANGVRELMRRFGGEKQQTLPDYFQAVIRTEIIRGDPAKSSVVAARALPSRN
jgi:hypothetical protein